MSSRLLQTHAKIQMTVEVTAGVWGEDCKMEHIFDSAGQEALEKLEILFQKNPEIKIISAPKVVAVLTKRQET